MPDGMLRVKSVQLPVTSPTVTDTVAPVGSQCRRCAASFTRYFTDTTRSSLYNRGVFKMALSEAARGYVKATTAPLPVGTPPIAADAVAVPNANMKEALNVVFNS
jgi:hypothetical protein